MDQKKNIKEMYQRADVAKVFDEERKKYLFQRYRHKIETNFLIKTIKNFNKNKKLKILDVACGTGRMLPEITKLDRKIEYNGLDSSEAMVSYLKEKSKKAKFPINIKLGDATKIPFKDNKFDLTYTFHLTWHLPKNLQIKIIKEMIRVTKKGGYVIFDVLNKNFIWEKLKKRLGKNPTKGIYKVNISEIKKLMKGYSFDIEKLSDFPIKNSFLYSIMNIINVSRKILPQSLFHMIYFRIRK